MNNEIDYTYTIIDKPTELKEGEVRLYSESRRVEGIRLDEDIVSYVDRVINLAQWCGGRSYMMHSDSDSRYYPDDPGVDHIVVPTPSGEVRAFVDEWIIRAMDGTFSVGPPIPNFVTTSDD